ncbi:3343_t:CDS:2, partial [Paraglomus occultum]
ILRKCVIELVVEVKKTITEANTNQAIAELIAANVLSSKRPVAILTDFSVFSFFWISKQTSSVSPTIFSTGFSDVYQAATFARLILNPELLTQEENEEIQQTFPFFERRAELEYRAVEDVNVDNDVGNLDDFVEEMTPLEYDAHKMTKKLARFRPH